MDFPPPTEYEHDSRSEPSKAGTDDSVEPLQVSKALEGGINCYLDAEFGSHETPVTPVPTDKPSPSEGNNDSSETSESHVLQGGVNEYITSEFGREKAADDSVESTSEPAPKPERHIEEGDVDKIMFEIFPV